MIGDIENEIWFTEKIDTKIARVLESMWSPFRTFTRWVVESSTQEDKT